MRVKLNEDPLYGEKPISVPEADLITMYAEWTIADDLLKRLDYMDSKEREKHLKLDGSRPDQITFESVTEEHAELYGWITAWEAAGGGELFPALDRQLKRRIETWENLLQVAKRTNFDDPDMIFGDFEEYCTERTILEYAANAIVAARFDESRPMEPLPYFDEFAVRRSASDALFRKLLGGRYEYAPWAIPANVFWWHHSPEEVRKAEQKEKRKRY